MTPDPPADQHPHPRHYPGFVARSLLAVAAAGAAGAGAQAAVAQVDVAQVAMAQVDVARWVWGEAPAGLLGVVLTGVVAAPPAALLAGGWGLLRRHRLALEAAATDDQTGLGSPGAFHDDLARAVARARAQGLPLVLGLVEVLGLDDVARHDGRRAADRLLLQAGATLRKLSRRDRELEAYRAGPETFTLLLVDTTVDDAFTVADAVTRRVAAHAAPLTATVGLAALDPDRTPDPETLLIAAGAALEHARTLGGGRVVAAAADATRWVES